MGTRARSRSRSSSVVLWLIFAAGGLAAAQARQVCPQVQNVQERKALGLLGATIVRVEPDIDHYGQKYPEEIVLLKKGTFYRKIHTEMFDWNWMFWDDGKQIIADTSPLHFSQTFALIDVADGKEVAAFAIPQSPEPAPPWVLALEQKQASQGSSSSVDRADCRFRGAASPTRLSR